MSTTLDPYANQQIDVDAFVAFAKARGAQRLDDLRQYVETLNRDAPKLGLNPALAAAQSLHECADRETASKVYVSVPWTYGLNPAGIGVESDALWRVYDFKTGEHAACVQLLQLFIYFHGTDLPAGFSSSQSPRWPKTIAAKPSRIACATTVEDLNGMWATDDTYAAGITKWYARILAAGIISDVPAGGVVTGDTKVPTTTQNPAVVFGNVKKFGYIDLQSEMANKPEGVGWDNLGKRDMLGLVLHRMYGTLNGTRVFFRDPATQALTDFAVGVEAIDGKTNAGVIQQYNDPFGYRSGWASGRVSAPYGDGKAFVEKYGVNAVNKRLTSLEISGFENTPIDDFAWGEIVHFVAYWADQCHISWEQFPINPATGISFLFWHQEMTFGTGKLCPWQVVMSRTNELIEDVKAVLKAAQTSGVVTPPVVIPPIVIPAPTYAAAVPITELAMLADRDFAGSKPYRDVTLANGKKLRARVVLDKVKVTNPSSFYQQYAIAGGKRTKPDPQAGDLVDVVFSITADDGNEYWIDPQWARIAQDKALLAED